MIKESTADNSVQGGVVEGVGANPAPPQAVEMDDEGGFMETLKITAENVEQYRNTRLEFCGHIEIAAGLGRVSFVALSATGSISALPATGHRSR